eukprot:NODE_935_length_1306_cov_312.880096.p1 GENE.NODE_935_length_1306_cov_312.880096~~NODE_935_length_1306_cov_312.880096.p1  ORF type:complete len:384 (-),score=104.94 NODE_935_length_1306_cov_312.880096:137-1288(-)
MGSSVINKSGHVMMVVLFRLEIHCAMDFHHLPFDRQQCPIRLSSFQYNASFVRLVQAPGGINESISFGANGMTGVGKHPWVIDTPEVLQRSQVFGTGSNLQIWDTQDFTLWVHRESPYNFRKDFLNSVLIVLMSWSGFFILRTASPARVTLAVIPVLTMLNHLNSVAKLTPPIPYFTFLDVFLLICLTFCFLCVVEYGFLHHLLRREAACERRLAILRTVAKELGEGEGLEVAVEGLKCIGSEASSYSRDTASDDDHFGGSLTMLQKEALFSACANFGSGRHLAITREMLHKRLRQYCCYYTPAQVSELFLLMGISEERDMSLSTFISFLRKFPKPTPVMNQTLRDTSPSLRLDIIMRAGFLGSFVLAIMIMFLVWAAAIAPT